MKMKINNENGNKDISQEAQNVIEILNTKEKARISEICKMKCDSISSKTEKAVSLCSIIAFYAGADRVLIKEVIDAFVFDEELTSIWKIDSFREEIVSDAIERCNGNFDVKGNSLPFVYIDKKGKEIIHAKVFADYFCKCNHLINVKDPEDIDSELYIYGAGVYVRLSYIDFGNYACRILENSNPGLVKTTLFKEVFSLIKMSCPLITRDELDSNETIINCLNCLIKVTKDGITTLPHTPDEYCTIQLPFEWKDEIIETPQFDSFMKTFTGDNEAIKILLCEFMGVTISNIRGSRFKAALFLVGDGDTGKSVLKSLTEYLIGDNNYGNAELQELEARFGTSTAYRKRLVGSSDMKACSLKELNNFKKMTGGDSIQAEYKGQNAFHFRYKGTMWFCCNKLPYFGGDTGKLVYKRMLIVRCRNVISEEEQDTDLVNKLISERDGIAQKLIFAVQRVIANNYKYDIPDCVVKERADYSTENNSSLAFIQKYLFEWGNIPKRNSVATTGFIYKVYKAWHKDNYHGTCDTEAKFKAEVAAFFKVSDMNTLITRVNGNSYYRVCTLSNDIIHDYISII